MEGPNCRETTRSLPPKPPTHGYKAGGYDPSERAYLVESTGLGDPPDCTFVLDASKDSPLLNPAVLVKNWGCLPATLTINGKTRQPGKDFTRFRPNGDYRECPYSLVLTLRQMAIRFPQTAVERGPASQKPSAVFLSRASGICR